MTDSQHIEFGADSYITKTDKIMEELEFRNQVLMQIQPKIWLETSAGSCNLLNVKIILFTTGNWYCLFTRLRKSIKVLVVSTCVSPILLDFQERVKENSTRRPKKELIIFDHIQETFITKLSTRR